MTMATGVYGKFLLTLGTGSPNFLLNAGDTIKLALVTDAETPVFDTDQVYGDVSANEVLGTGWTASGTLNSPTFTQDTTLNLVKLSGANVSAASTTLTNIRGVVPYDDTIATPVVKPLICAINFGQTYSTTAGTLAITWNIANGLMYITY